MDYSLLPNWFRRRWWYWSALIPIGILVIIFIIDKPKIMTQTQDPRPLLPFKTTATFSSDETQRTTPDEGSIQKTNRPDVAKNSPAPHVNPTREVPPLPTSPVPSATQLSGAAAIQNTDMLVFLLRAAHSAFPALDGKTTEVQPATGSAITQQTYTSENGEEVWQWYDPQSKTLSTDEVTFTENEKLQRWYNQNGGVEKIQFDSNGNGGQLKLDSAGRPQRLRTWADNGHEVDYNFDEHGNITSIESF